MTTTTLSKTCNWNGASGKTYGYHVNKLPASFNKGQYGNYVYAKLNANNRWVPVYIGEGDLGERISDNHHKALCIRNKGATHVHVHIAGTKAEGTAEEKDLLANYKNAFVPTGCNEALGG
jgi:hypothetical protein